MNAKLFTRLFSLILVLALAGCNFPGAAPESTATPTETATLPPPPPTATPEPPTPTSPPPTPTTQLLLPTLPPTSQSTPLPPPTVAPVFTPTSIVPLPGVRFEGEFAGGIFSFRVNNNSNAVTLKEIILSKATCNNGRIISDRMQFPVVSFPIENGKFAISLANAFVSGYFSSASTATGSLNVTVKAERYTCEFGPVSWKAVAGGQ